MTPITSDSYTIARTDAPNEQGVHHRYTVSYKLNNRPGVHLHAINFQSSPTEINGVTDKLLLEIIRERHIQNPEMYNQLTSIINLLP